MGKLKEVLVLVLVIITKATLEEGDGPLQTVLHPILETDGRPPHSDSRKDTL